MSCTLRSQIGDLSQPNTGSQHLFKAVLHRYYWRKVGLQWMKRMGKGAILVLIWFLIIQSGYYLIRHEFIWRTKVQNMFVPRTGFVVIVIISPLAGWLADVYFGRYKVIKWSITTDSMEFFIASYMIRALSLQNLLVVMNI